MKPIRFKNKDGVEMSIDHRGRIKPAIVAVYDEPQTTTRLPPKKSVRPTEPVGEVRAAEERLRKLKAMGLSPEQIDMIVQIFSGDGVREKKV